MWEVFLVAFVGGGSNRSTAGSAVAAVVVAAESQDPHVVAAAAALRMLPVRAFLGVAELAATPKKDACKIHLRRHHHPGETAWDPVTPG